MKRGPTPRELAVTFIIVDLSHERLMGVQRIGFDEIFHAGENTPPGEGIGRSVELPHSDAERQRMIVGHPGPAILPGPPGINYRISRDEKGDYHVQAGLTVHDAKDFVWVGGGPRNAPDALRLGWHEGLCGGYFKSSPPATLSPREGNSGVFLLPDITRPKYAVCYVVAESGAALEKGH